MNPAGNATPGGRWPLVAVLTPPGRGPLAVVGVTGSGAGPLVDTLFRARGGRPIAARPDGAIAFGRWGGPAGEEVVVVRHAADRVEVHCHGGLAASAAICAGLVAGGAREVGWRQWLAHVDAGAGLVAAEAREALALVRGPQAAAILCRQLAGALDAAIAGIERLVAAGERAAAHAAADRLLRAARVGLRLARPWRVVLAGAVNAGKSSLVNALAGHARAIVSPVPGTTRDLLETRIVLDGWDVELVDAAGERAPGDAAGDTEAAGIARATAAAATADLVLRVVAADATPPPPRPRELIVLAKCDLAPAGPPHDPATVRTSAVTGEGIAALGDRIVAAVVPEAVAEPALLSGAVPFTERQGIVIQGLVARVGSHGPGC